MCDLSDTNYHTVWLNKEKRLLVDEVIKNYVDYLEKLIVVYAQELKVDYNQDKLRRHFEEDYQHYYGDKYGNK